MRIVTGCISHETNVFSPIKATYEEFEKWGIWRKDDVIKSFSGTNTATGGIIDVCKREGVELIPTVNTFAMPSAHVARSALDGFLEELLDGIKKAGKIDGVCLELHGAMRADDPIYDGEGYILRHVRELVGPDMPVTSSLDYHANMTRDMITHANALHIYDTYPHIDAYETGVAAAETIVRTIRGEIRPAMGWKQIPLAVGLTYQFTGSIPMSTIMEYVARLEKKHPAVLDISVAAGFCWSDFKDALHSVTVVTDNEPELAQDLAEDVAELSWNLRKLFIRPLVPPAEAVRLAMQSKLHPVVFADVADNPGAGGSCDGAEILRALVEGGARNTAVGPIADPEAVEECARAGVGNSITLEVGAKTDEFHGKPVKVTGTVKAITDGTYVRRGPMMNNTIDKMGKTVRLDLEGVQVMLSTNRVQPLCLEVFRHVGIEPTQKDIVVVKSCAHFRAAYEPIARGGVLEVDAPGLSHPDLSRYAFKEMPRPFYPVDEM